MCRVPNRRDRAREQDDDRELAPTQDHVDHARETIADEICDGHEPPTTRRGARWPRPSRTRCWIRSVRPARACGAPPDSAARESGARATALDEAQRQTR